jgi:hypothetical protein
MIWQPQHVIIDRYIAQKAPKVGDTFRHRDVAAWAIAAAPGLDVSTALQAHRTHPHERRYTTERIGWGPDAFYRVVETPTHIDPAAVKRMHERFGQESVAHWMRERSYRMEPVAVRDPRARAAMRKAQRQMALVATTLDAELEGL